MELNLSGLKNVSPVKCEICGFQAHFLEPHLVKAHNMSVQDYQAAYQGAEVLSEAARLALRQQEAQCRNELVEYDIKATFGVEVSKKYKTVTGFKLPHETTPPIDSDYKFRKDQLAVILFELLNPDEKTLFTGPTGSGKTSALEQVAARLNRPFFRINMDQDIGRADFVGQWIAKGTDMEFLYGILPRSMRHEYAIFVVDEWDCMNPSNAMALQAVMEGKPLTIAETCEYIHPARGWAMFCTANTVGQGDDTGLYAGTQVQNYASLDRFTMVEEVDYSSKQEEACILRKKVGLTDQALCERFGVTELRKGAGAEDVIDKILEVARLVREAHKKGEFMGTMSTRTVVNIAKKLLAFGDIKVAYRRAYLNKLTSTEDVDFVGNLIQRVWAV